MKLRHLLLSVAVLISPLQISAQNLIYKKNGEIVKAKIITKSGKSITFKHFEPIDSLTYFLNIAAIDSIIFQNGVEETFVKSIDINHSLTGNLVPVYNHHLIGIDLAGYLLYRNITLSYEYLPGKAKLGFKAAFTKNIETVPYPSIGFNFNRIPDWSTRLGINYYIFPPRTFRLGTGLYYIFGKYSNAYYSTYDPNPTNILDKRNMSELVLSAFGFYNLNKNLAINFGLDSPIYINPASSIFQIVIRCEILLNF